MDELRYPIGIQTFPEIREEGYVYIDKTRRVFDLARRGKFYFLSRPRRFGKSLLISTLEAYFSGQKELFRGLAMEELEQDWTVYPVLHLDFNAQSYTTPDALEEVLDDALQRWEATYGADDPRKALPLRFKNVVERAYEQTGQRVVILVDEYDKPLTQTILNPELHETYRTQLKAFYSVLKTQDRYLRFALLTGVTRFSKVSIFSDLNNLKDISMSPEYADICGITEAEIHRYMEPSVQALASALSLTYEEACEQLRQNYDGYHFGPDTPGVYNPFSLINALQDKKLYDFWFETGTPTFLVEVLKRSDYDLERLTQEEQETSVLNSIERMEENPIPVIYQSGYLTIHGYDTRFRTYTLGFPNGEVERGFCDFLLPYYTPIRSNSTAFVISRFVLAVERGDPEDFMERLVALYEGTNYQVVGDMEKHYQNSLFLIFTLMGQFTQTEYHTARGSIDLLVQTKDYVYLIECKLDKSAQEALRQIDERGYAAPFAKDPRRLFKIGINFSTATRGIEGYLIESRPAAD